MAVRLHTLMYRTSRFRPLSLPCPVVSVGNLTVGGTGKTPMTMYTALLLKKSGYRVAVLSRGYKGQAEKKGGVVSDGRQIIMDARTAGDEPLMMARRLEGVPVLVGRNRHGMGLHAISRFGSDILVLDDGFQHRRLQRDLDLVLMDQKLPWGNGHLVPRGPLREPLTALTRATAVVLTAASNHPIKTDRTIRDRISRIVPDRPLFHAMKKPGLEFFSWAATQTADKAPITADISLIKGRRTVAFSGLADNRAFRLTAAELGCDMVGWVEFGDHHWYRPDDLQRIENVCRDSRADLLVTSAKDYARLPLRHKWPLDLAVLGLDINMGPQTERFENFILERLQLHPARENARQQ